MIYASFVYGSSKNNIFFGTSDLASPYTELKKAFLNAGVELNTPDLNRGRHVTFEFHLNAQRRAPKAVAYVHLAENPLIRPLNRNFRALDKYAKWFVWDGELAGKAKAEQVFLPNRLIFEEFKGPEDRPMFLVLVAANKALVKVDQRDQYRLRHEIINWYEKKSPTDFRLYGQGWDRPFALPGTWARFYTQFFKAFPGFCTLRSKLRTWHGLADDKIELLKHARFCIAHENCRNLPGYITEKIFDCFRAGCVPVYVGPREIHDFIPEECFIDGRKFSNPAEMDAFLRAIDDETYRGYQNSIKEFLLSEKARPFSQEYFAETVVKTILADLAANKP